MRTKVLGIILVFFLLASCQSSSSDPYQIRTPQEWSDSFTNEDEFDLDLFRDPTRTALVPSPTPTRDFSAPNPTPTPPVVPTIMLDQVHQPYLRATPSPEDLLEALQFLNDQMAHRNWLSGSEETELADALGQDNAWLSKALDIMMEAYYPNGIPDPLTFFENRIEADWLVPYYPPFFLRNMSKIVLNEITEDEHSLEDGEVLDGSIYEGYVQLVELDHDSGPEWLIKIVWEYPPIMTWLLLDEQEDHNFAELEIDLPAEVPVGLGLGESEIKALQDFTGDGLTDLIYLQSYYAMGTDWGTFYIAQGSPSGISLIDEVQQLIAGYLSQGLMYEIGVPPGSNWLTLTLTQPNSINWGCEWETDTSYSWPYGTAQTITRNEAPPYTPECNLAQAVNITNPPATSSAITYLERAINAFDPTDPEQAAKLLFARYRLSILYALNNQQPAAQRQFARFVEDYSGPPQFVNQQLLPLLSGDQINPLSLCNIIAEADWSVLPEDWIVYVNATAALNAYPYSAEVYPPAICPFRDTLIRLIRTIQFDPRTSPEDLFLEAGIPYLLITGYPIAWTDEYVWFALVGAETYYVTAYFPDETSFEWQITFRFDPFIGHPEVFMQDTTGDGYQELVIYGQVDKSGICDHNQETYELFVTTSVGLGYLSIADYECVHEDAAIDFSSYLADNNGDGLVDWVMEEVVGSDDYSNLTAERTEPLTWFSASEVESMFQDFEDRESAPEYLENLRDDPSAVRNALIDLLDSLDLQDQTQHRIWQRMVFFIGLTYEIQSNSLAALTWYSKILDDGFHTIWLYLAALSFVFD